MVKHREIIGFLSFDPMHSVSIVLYALYPRSIKGLDRAVIVVAEDWLDT